MKKSPCKTIVLFVFIFIYCPQGQAQSWEWNGYERNETIKEYIWGTIQKMNTQLDCSKYNYGKSKYQKIDVLSYSADGFRIRFKFKFYWQIDYDLAPSSQFSFTVYISTTADGCKARMTFENEDGSPDCNISTGRQADLGCIY